MHTPDQIAAIVFLDIAVIVVIARLMGRLFRKLRQPAVVGEILAGILLGPSLLGTLPGDPSTHLFPADVRPFLKVVAQLGLVIFMFIVGLELDLTLVRGKERFAATISLASVVLPFTLGAGLSLWLYANNGEVAGKPVDKVSFALFLGASMSVTAFPVLARILTERGMQRTQIGALTLACAAVDDVLAWSILAVVLAVASSGGAWDLPLVLAESLAFVAFMFVVVRPRLRALVRRHREVGHLTPDLLAVIVVGFLASAFVTEEIGIHVIFGAFLFGVVMPREDSKQLFDEVLEKLEQVSVLLLLPVFFISTGLNVDVTGLRGDGVLELGAVLLVACSGKFLGAAGAARALGLKPRKAAAVGILMNTRGLTELVILNVGLSIGVLTPKLFTILVVMAVFTTIITEPLLRLVYPDRVLARDVADAERASLGVEDAFRVVVLVGAEVDDDSALLVDIGAALLGDERPAELVLSRFAARARDVEVGSGLFGELAAVTASLTAMQGLVKHAAEHGARAVVRSQFSQDAAADLLAQLDAVQADVVLLPSDSSGGLADRVLERAECAVALQRGDAAMHLERVGVPLSTDDDGCAALEQAVRAARRRRLPLVLVPADDRRSRKRAVDLLQRLRLAGMQVTVGERDALARPATLVVVAVGGAVPEGYGVSVLEVQARRDDHGEGLQGLLDSLPTELPEQPRGEHVVIDLTGTGIPLPH